MGHGWVPVFGSPCPRLSDTVNNNRIEQWSRSNSPFSRMDWRKTKQAPSFFLFPFVPSPRLLPMGSIHAKYNSGYTSPLATTFLSFAGILASVLKQRIAINSLFWCHVKKKKKRLGRVGVGVNMFVSVGECFVIILLLFFPLVLLFLSLHSLDPQRRLCHRPTLSRMTVLYSAAQQKG